MSSDSDEENTLRYGTPLEPYEEDEIPSKRKYQDPTDQYAVDAHGRRRFHGAFTGGFSAGFGNTVGSSEGWTPTNFKSSRKEKGNFAAQRPEDFMDDEDRSEFGIAPRQMETHSEFSGQKRQRPKQYHDGPIPGEPVLEQLIRPIHETAAVKLLNRMGWKEGQGIGERLSRKEKKREGERRKVYGCYMPGEDRAEQPQSESSDSEFEFDTLFAPDDYAPYTMSNKSDKFGLDYTGLSRHSVLGKMVGEYGESSGVSHLVMKEKGKKVSIRGQAFGVGAFETEDDDIYAKEDMSHYDFTLGPGPSREEKKKKNTGQIGRVLPGFVKSSVPLPGVKSYPPPALPKDYVPAAVGTRRTRFEPTNDKPRDQGLGRHELSAEARGILLGEPKQHVPKITQEDPIAKLLGRNVNFVSKEQENVTKIDENQVVQEKSLEENFISIKDSGKELNKVFKPFVGNPAKQTRYEKYLKDKNGYLKDAAERSDNIGSWEKERELMEFEQAAKLYQPLSGIMRDRFTHASEPDDALNPLTAVAKSSINYGLVTQEQVDAAQKGFYGIMTRKKIDWMPNSLVCKRFNVPEPGGSRLQTPKEDKPKVSYSIFSYLETSVHDKDSFAKEQTKFSGSKSVTDTVNTSSQKDTQAGSSFDHIYSRNNDHSRNKDNSRNETTVPGNTNIEGSSKRMTVAEMFLKESEKNQKQGIEVTETIKQFDKMDLYKSIFLSDSEEEVVETTKPKEIDFDELIGVPKNVERNDSPPRGIFANIDFDEINSWRRKSDKTTESIAEKTKEKSTENDSSEKKSVKNQEDCISKEKNNETNETVSEEYYGPKIPENLQKRLENPPTDFRPIFTKTKSQNNEIHEIDSSSSDSWVEKDVKSKKSKKKKSKKHKSKHKKSKHKKKDK